MDMMERIISDIRNSLENKCYFAALALTLTLPDICGSAEYPSYKDNVPKRYIEWAEKYIGKLDEGTPYLSGEIIYNIRNKFLHRGEPSLNTKKINDESNKVDCFYFVIGDATKIWSCQACINSQRAMVYDITYFCELITNCAELYYRNNMEKFHFDYDVILEEELFTTI